MSFSRELNLEIERRNRLRTIMVAASTLTPEDQATLVNAIAGESSYSLPISLEQAALKSMGAEIFEIGLALSGGRFSGASDEDFATVVNDAWSKVMATLLWAGAHGVTLPIDERARDIIGKELGVKVPTDVTNYGSYLKWAGAAAGMGAVLLGRVRHPVAVIAGLLLGGVAPLLEERAAEEERAKTDVPNIIVPGPNRGGAAITDGGSATTAKVIQKAGS